MNMAPYQQIFSAGVWQRHSHKMASTVKKSFCVLRYHGTVSAAAVCRSFHSERQQKPPFRGLIAEWCKQFAELGATCKGESKLLDVPGNMTQQPHTCCKPVFEESKSGNRTCSATEKSDVSLQRGCCGL